LTSPRPPEVPARSAGLEGRRPQPSNTLRPHRACPGNFTIRPALCEFWTGCDLVSFEGRIPKFAILSSFPSEEWRLPECRASDSSKSFRTKAQRSVLAPNSGRSHDRAKSNRPQRARLSLLSTRNLDGQLGLDGVSSQLFLLAASTLRATPQLICCRYYGLEPSTHFATGRQM
jgi:hypothetical protein